MNNVKQMFFSTFEFKKKLIAGNEIDSIKL